MTVTRWPVWVRNLRGRSGVYLVRDAESKTLLYVGHGRTDVKAALVRHFHAGSDSTRAFHTHAVFDRRTVDVKLYFAPPEAVRGVEADLIALLKPTMNVRPEASSRVGAASPREPGGDDVVGWLEWKGDAGGDDDEGVPF